MYIYYTYYYTIIYINCIQNYKTTKATLHKKTFKLLYFSSIFEELFKFDLFFNVISNLFIIN